MCEWMDQRLPKGSVVATNFPPLVHLYTGCKTVSSTNLAESWEDWRRLGVRYVAYFPVFDPGVDPAERNYQVVYHTRGSGNFRVLDLGDPATRGPWGTPNPSGPARIQSGN